MVAAVDSFSTASLASKICLFSLEIMGLKVVLNLSTPLISSIDGPDLALRGGVFEDEYRILLLYYCNSLYVIKL